MKEENEDGVSLLVIQNATAYNMGSYTCYAWNDRGNVSKTVRVTVKGKDNNTLQFLANKENQRACLSSVASSIW